MNEYIVYAITLLYGILIGSFLNVCIYRIPNKSSIVTERSHCMSCNRKLKWYDMVPLFSYLFLLGKCRSCKAKISIQYPIIEAFNGILYVVVFHTIGYDSYYKFLLSTVFCLTSSALIVLSVIDFRTKTIPFGINVYIFVMGLAVCLIEFFLNEREFTTLLNHFIGFFAVSLFMLLIFYLTKSRGFGGGDIKLMAAAGVLLGWEQIILAFFIGCFLASIIHPIIMIAKKLGKELAFGPYLSAGILVAMLYGNQLVDWYLQTFFN